MYWKNRYTACQRINDQEVMNLLEIDPQEFSEFKSALSAAEYLIENLVDLLTEKGYYFRRQSKSTKETKWIFRQFDQ